MAKPIGRTFVEIDVDAKKYNKGIVDVKTTTKKKLSEIEKAWKGMGKKSEATIDQMKAKINKDYDTIKKHSLSTADDIVRAEKAKNEKIAKINKQQFGDQKSWIDKAKKHWMALSAAAIGAIYAIGRALKEGIDSFADWETALVDMSKVTDESLESITDRIRELPPELGTATELVKGYYQVISAGVTEPKKAIDLLTVAAKLAKSAHIDLDEVIKGLTKVMAGYEGEIEATTEAADLLYAIEREGQTAVAELIPVIGGLAKISKDMEVAANEMGAALATITLTAGTTSEAATRYEAVLIALMKPTTAMKKAINELGYESAQLAIKDIGLTEVLKKLKESTGDSADKMAELFGRKEALVGISALASKNFETLTSKTGAMAKKTGMADKAWQEYMKTLNAIWDTFKNTIGNQLIIIGEKLAPAIKKVVEKTGEWFKANEDIITQNFATVIDAIATVAEALAKVYGALAKAQKAVAEQVNKLSEAQQESIKLTLEQSTGLAGAKAVFKLFADAYVYWLGKFTKEEEEWTVTIGRRKKAQDEGNKTIDKTTDAINETASALEISGSYWIDYTRDVVSSANKSYVAWKDAMEDTAVETASELDISSSYWDDYTRDIINLAKEAYSKTTKTFKDANAEQLVSIRNMYKDMESYGDEYWMIRKRLIDIQLAAYKEMFKDIEGMEKVYIAWAKKAHEDLERDKTLASDSFFAGMKIGLEDMEDVQTTWAERGKELFDDIRSSWQGAVDDMVDAFIIGEGAKIDIAQVTGDLLADITSSFAKRMWMAAIDSIVGLIGALIGQLFAGAGGWGAVKAGAKGAAVEVGVAIAATGVAMAAARSQADKFRASGGWIGQHPFGGPIQEGSGARDDVLLGYTSGARHWGMGGEYVINKESTARHRDLIELINRDRGLATGGYLDRGYQEGAVIPWEPVADMLAMGAGGSFLHGLYKGGGVYSAIAEAIQFFAVAVISMFTGKYLVNKFKAEGGIIDIGHLDLGPITDIADAVTNAANSITAPLKDLPIVGDLIEGVLDWFDPEFLWKKTLELIRVPLEAVAKDLVTPGKYYSDPIDTIVNLLENIDLSVPHLQHGGRIPRTGLFYGHEGEQVIPKEEAKFQGNRPIHVHLNLDGREVGLAIVKDGDVVQQMDYQLTKMNRRVYV